MPIKVTPGSSLWGLLPEHLRGPVESPEQILLREKEARERRELEERAEAERQRLIAMPPEFVITLVHGTQLFRWLLGPLVREFAVGPPWIQPESGLARHLREALGWRVRIEPFRWKAYNTVRAREIATAQLRDHLDAMRARDPDAKQVVIAHSHGGNVALMAMSDPVEAQRVLGVATLATPFLTARPRRVKGLLDGGDAIAAALMSGFAAWAVGLALGHGMTWWTWGLATSGAVVVLMLAGMWAMKRMEKHAAEICAAMPDTKLGEDQLTVIRTRGDEAAAVIAGARVAGAFVDLGWRRISEPVLHGLGSVLERVDYFGLRSLYRKIERKESGVRSFPFETEEKTSLSENLRKYVVPTLGPIAVTVFQDQQSPAARWIVLGIAGVYGLPALLALLVTVISVVPAVVFSLGLVPCGWSVPLAGPYLDMTAEPAPPGTWPVTQVEPDANRGLAHSKSYDDPRVHEHLAKWIRRRADAGRAEK